MPAQEFEQHHGLDPGLDLRRQIPHRRLGQQRYQPLEQRRSATRILTPSRARAKEMAGLRGIRPGS